MHVHTRYSMNRYPKGMFTFSQLHSFVAVAEEMHFGRAAERLNMTQPPLSRQIQNLERDLGFELFDRTRRTIRLTSAGIAFLPKARHLLNLTRMAAEVARRTSLGLAGAVHVGFTSALGHSVLPSLLRRAAAELTDVDLILHEMVSGEQISGLRASTLDLGMIRPTAHDDALEFRRLPPERLIVALPRLWNLPVTLRRTADTDADTLPSIDLAALGGRDFVTYSEDGARYFHELLTAAFNLLRITPRYTQRVTQVHTMLNFVDAGIGAALVPESARHWASENTVLAEAPQLVSFPAESRLAWQKESTNPALRSVLMLL